MALSGTKIFFDPVLGQNLRDFRINYNKKAKDVAAHIGKSGAYISKLEKGQIKQINRNDLVKILNFITGEKNGYELFIESNIKDMNPDELTKSIPINNFDWIERQIPIPQEYVAYISAKITKLNTTTDELTQYINANDDLDDKFFADHNIDKKDLMPNQWNIYFEADCSNVHREYIYVVIDDQLIDNIINHKILKTSYLFLYMVVYQLYKIEETKSQPYLSAGKLQKIKTRTTKKLRDFKIYTMVDKQMAIRNAATGIDTDLKPSSYDSENRKLVNELNDGLFFMSERDVEYVNKKLCSIISTLKNTNSFGLAYMALDLSPLYKANSTTKKEFLNAVQSLAKEYASTDADSLEQF